MSKTENDIFIVGVGAAAGGLKAIPEFLGGFKEEPKNFSVILVQHQIVDHPEEINQVIKKISRWPVEQVEHGKEIKAGKLYTAPPNFNITVIKKSFCLTPSKNQPYSPSIDLFFESLAKELKSRAIGVLLSGYGNDGSEGAKSIKEHGGYIICQTPGTAEFNDMPEAVIVGGYCDADLPPAGIFQEIVEHIDSQLALIKIDGKIDSFHAIFEKLAVSTGTDFSLYKPTTLQRRVSKRLEMLKVKDIGEYLKLVTKQPEELDELFKVVLIGVTDFFRNPEAFEALQSPLMQLISEKSKGSAIRIWSVGCSKGQEAYSAAILISELLQEKISHYKIQIFATDIDSESLHFARKGIYKKEHLETIPKNLLEKYFEKNGDDFEVKKQIRQLVLFSKHDITVDPPFVRLDLILCRNLLIYFNNELQRETLKLSHYILNKNGILFLGKSESVSIVPDLFEVIENKNKLFRRAPGSTIYSLQYNRFRRIRPDTLEKEKRPGRSKDLSFTENAKETLFSIFEHPYVIINDSFQVKKVHGSVRLYMEISQGQMDVNVLKMVNPEFTVELRALMVKTQKTGEIAHSKVIKFNVFESDNYVRIKVAPLLFQMHNREHYMVIFEKVDIDPKYDLFKKNLSLEELKNLRIRELEDELATSREHIQAFAEELETSNEELQSLNEELQSANEELKSSNEELETSNEELQSTNEELNAANAELRQRNEDLLDKEKELNESKTKLENSEYLYRTLADNFPNGTVGTVDQNYEILFVAGRDLENYNYKPHELIGKKIFQRMEEKSVNSLKSMIDNAYNGIPCHDIIHHKEVFYDAYIIPIMGNSHVETVMFLNHNVTEQRNLISKLRESEGRFKQMTDTAPVMVWMSGLDKKCYYFNKSWLEFTGRTMEQECGYGWTEGLHPTEREFCLQAYDDAFDKQEPFSIEFRLKRFDGRYIWILDKGVPRYDEEGNFLGFIGGCTDIHEHKELENKKDEFMNIASHELKTPLTTAKAYFQLVQEMIPGRGMENAEINDYIKKALESLNKLALLVDDLLDITRIETGKLLLHEEEIDFDELLKEILDDHKRIVNSHKIMLLGGTRKIIRGDKRLLEQAIVNLISNAVKFSPNQDEIELRIMGKGRTLELTVKDHGIGIAKDDLKRIFDPFYQTNIKKYRSGLGLGLFICKGIVEKHGGDIEAISELGYGTSITIKLPTL